MELVSTQVQGDECIVMVDGQRFYGLDAKAIMMALRIVLNRVQKDRERLRALRAQRSRPKLCPRSKDCRHAADGVVCRGCIGRTDFEWALGAELKFKGDRKVVEEE